MMLRKALLVLAPMFGGAVAPAVAADPVAIYAERSGSVAPPYAWNWVAQILADGGVSVTYCRGYATEPPGCATAEGAAVTGALDGIAAASASAGLPESPMREAEEVPVGGGSSSGAVWIQGQRFDIPAFPAEADAQRAASLLAAILSAVPPDLLEKAKRAALQP
jgi:hypothetical protein